MKIKPIESDNEKITAIKILQKQLEDQKKEIKEKMMLPKEFFEEE